MYRSWVFMRVSRCALVFLSDTAVIGYQVSSFRRKLLLRTITYVKSSAVCDPLMDNKVQRVRSDDLS